MTIHERMAVYTVPENHWPYKLAPKLTGKAQQAYAAIEPERASEVKPRFYIATILARRPVVSSSE